MLHIYFVSVGEFVLVHASYQSHLGSDCLFAPNSKLADGIIWLVVIRAGISRGQLLQVGYLYVHKSVIFQQILSNFMKPFDCWSYVNSVHFVL
jgi:hypothetical protein